MSNYIYRQVLNSLGLLFHVIYEPESNCKDLKENLETKKRNFHT